MVKSELQPELFLHICTQFIDSSKIFIEYDLILL